MSEVSHAIYLKATRTQDVAHTSSKCKAIEVTEVNSKKSIPRSQVVGIIDGDDELKRHSRTIPDVHFKEFSLTKQKTRPRMISEWIAKTS